MKIFLDLDIIKMKDPILEAAPILAETKKHLDVGDLIEINNDVYSIRSGHLRKPIPFGQIATRQNMKYEWVSAKKLINFSKDREIINDRTDTTCWKEQEVICPVCGSKLEVEIYDEGNREDECEYCGARLNIETEIEIRHSTSCKEIPKIKKV